jgi:hypothetical protein
MSVEERKTRSSKKSNEIDEYLKGSLPDPEDDENEDYQVYTSNETLDYHLHDKEELESDEQYRLFLMDLPLDEKAKIYELWEKAHRNELMHLAEASDKRVMIKTIAIARNLLEWGMAPVDIAKNTGVPIEEVETLRQSI